VRWLKFSAVGAIGIVVQMGALAILRSGLHVQYLLATALAVEAAVLHNCVWHEFWTWRDRTGGHSGFLGRLLRFNFTTGAVSLAVNLGIMRLLVGQFRIPYLLANLIAIAAGSVANYLASEFWVFRTGNARQEHPRARSCYARSSLWHSHG
jgi:putative flippase GtrA